MCQQDKLLENYLFSMKLKLFISFWIINRKGDIFAWEGFYDTIAKNTFFRAQ